MALQKRKEHNLATWALFIDLVKAFDSVSREALWAVLRKFGIPDHVLYQHLDATAHGSNHEVQDWRSGHSRA